MIKKTLLGALLGLTCYGASAEGGYFGLSLGQTTYELSSDPATSPLPRADETGDAYKLLAGFDFNRFVGMEAGYQWFKNFGYSDPATPGNRVEYEGNAFSLDVLGRLPIYAGLSVFIKGGVAQASLRPTTVTAGAPTDGEPERGLVARYGAGAQYVFSNHLGVRFDFERNLNVTDPVTLNKGDLDFYGVSFIYQPASK